MDRPSVCPDCGHETGTGTYCEHCGYVLIQPPPTRTLGPHAQAMLDLMEDPRGHPEACVDRIAALKRQLQQSETAIGEVVLYARKLTLSSDRELKMAGADILDIIALFDPKA